MIFNDFKKNETVSYTNCLLVKIVRNHEVTN